MHVYRGEIGKSILVVEARGREGNCWGTDVYTDDSDVEAAAVHAGVLRVGEQGPIKITILEGRENYPGTTRNGVTSLPFGPFPGSFRVEKAVQVELPTPAAAGDGAEDF
jgi:hypothetical protein